MKVFSACRPRELLSQAKHYPYCSTDSLSQVVLFLINGALLGIRVYSLIFLETLWNASSLSRCCSLDLQLDLGKIASFESLFPVLSCLVGESRKISSVSESVLCYHWEAWWGSWSVSPTVQGGDAEARRELPAEPRFQGQPGRRRLCL